jgi:flagellar biosynthesis chaperone FliJ
MKIKNFKLLKKLEHQQLERLLQDKIKQEEIIDHTQNLINNLQKKITEAYNYHEIVFAKQKQKFIQNCKMQITEYENIIQKCQQVIDLLQQSIEQHFISEQQYNFLITQINQQKQALEAKLEQQQMDDIGLQKFIKQQEQ